MPFVPLQSPDIPNQLRKQLQLSGAGSFPMTLDTMVQPVAIVADTREQNVEQYRDYVGWGQALALAGQYAQASLRWHFAAARTRRIEVRRITVYSGSATPLYVGWSALTPGGAGTAYNRKSPRSAPGAAFDVTEFAGRIFTAAPAVAPVSSEYGFVTQLAAGVAAELDFTDSPWEMFEQNTTLGLTCICGAAATSLDIAFEWREYLNA